MLALPGSQLVQVSQKQLHNTTFPIKRIETNSLERTFSFGCVRQTFAIKTD